MKKLYETYLHVPKEGKIKEKVFVSRIAVAVVCMVCCLSAMGFSAYAYFTSSVTSGLNTIRAAVYSTDIVVTDSSNVLVAETKEDDATNSYSLSKGTYTVTIVAQGTATTGYCKVVVNDTENYYTAPITPNETLKFEIQCNDSSAEVRIITNWGSCSVKENAKIVENNASITIGNATENTTTFSEPASDITENKQEDTSDTATVDTPDTSQEASENTDTAESTGQDATSEETPTEENSESDDGTSIEEPEQTNDDTNG